MVEECAEPENIQDELISLPEAGDIFGFNPDYLRTLAQKGRLKARKVGRVWATTRRNMLTYIESRQRRGLYKENHNEDENTT